MGMTLDLTDDETDYLRRAITAHMVELTEALRAQEEAPGSAEVERMLADIRTAATLAGRLPFSRFARNSSNARSNYERDSTVGSDFDCGRRGEHRLPPITNPTHPVRDERGDD